MAGEKYMFTNKQISKIRKGLDGKDQRAIFKILGDMNRYRIFEMLSNHPKLTVSEMAKILKISIPLSSQHLKILEQGNILEKERQGQKVFYSLKTGNTITQSIIKEII